MRKQQREIQSKMHHSTSRPFSLNMILGDDQNYITIAPANVCGISRCRPKVDESMHELMILMILMMSHDIKREGAFEQKTIY